MLQEARRTRVFRASPFGAYLLSDHHHLYGRSAWRKLRRQQLFDEPMCRMCRELGQFVAAGVVDHVKPHRGDEELFFNAENLQSLCKRCHDSHKQAQEHNADGLVRGAGLLGSPLDRAHPWFAAPRPALLVVGVDLALPGADRSVETIVHGGDASARPQAGLTARFQAAGGAVVVAASVGPGSVDAVPARRVASAERRPGGVLKSGGVCPNTGCLPSFATARNGKGGGFHGI